MIFKTKNFLITFLIFLAIYQTANLWFESFSSHSFFYNLKNSVNATSMTKDMNYIIESIIINTGNNKFLRQYNNFYKAEYKKGFDEAISKCFSSGKYSYQNNLDMNYILENKSVIYNFAYDVQTNDLESVFQMKIKNIPKDISFNRIAIVPNTYSEKNIKTILFHSERNDAHIFKLNKNYLAENIYYTLENFSNFENKSFYSISSLKSGINLFSKNEFIPKAKNDQAYINKIKVTNPLEQEGGILLSGLEKYIDIFFDNHAIKWNSTIDDTYTYKDDNTVIKYYTNGVLEYVNYKASLVRDVSPYKLAIDFLAKDINIKNEYYLKSYEKTDEGIIFYFDYKINNFPIELSENIKQNTNMKSMIEVTVFDNKVSKYKRIVYNFSIDEDFNIWNNTFLDALDSVFLKRHTNDVKTSSANSINLQYNFNRIDELMELRWKIQIKDDIYFESIEDSD